MEVVSLEALIRFSDEKMQKVPLFDSEKYFCDLYCLRLGQDQRVHAHAESDKIYVVVRGSGLFHIGGEAILIVGAVHKEREGVSPGVVHAGHRLESFLAGQGVVSASSRAGHGGRFGRGGKCGSHLRILGA